MTVDWSLFIITLSLILTAFFSGIELAFISSNKLFFELKNKQGVRFGKIISGFISHPTEFITTTLLGSIISFVIFCVFSFLFIFSRVGASSIQSTVIAIALISLISIVIIDNLSRSLFLNNPDRILAMAAIPLQIIYVVLKPLVFVTTLFSKFFVLKVFKWKYIEEKPAFGLTDLNNFLQNRNIKQDERQQIQIDNEIFSNALEFKTVKLRDCMVPRADIETLDVSDSIEELKLKFVETGRSKILIYQNTIDQIVGYCHVSSLFHSPGAIAEIIIPISIVPESMSAQDLLVQFSKERKSIALVVDEFGGTSGIVTVEDIIEEIVGDIQDEHDEDDLVEDKIDEHNFLLSARLEIEYLNDKYGWTIPEGEYETIGGFISSVTGEIPDVDDVIYYPPYKFTVVSTRETSMDLVKVNISTVEIK